MSLPTRLPVNGMNDPALIHQVAETTSQRDRDALDQSIVQLLFQFLDARKIALYRVVQDGVQQRVSRRLVLERGRGAPQLTSCDDPDTLPMLCDTPVWAQCIARDEVLQFTLPDGLQRALFPVVSTREVAGLLEIDTRQALAPRDAHLVRGILRIFRNQLSLLDYGERDELTGLLNRKTFESHFGKMGAKRRAYRGGGEAQRRWLGLLDIDRFKSINDTYGHLFGDEVLLLVSRIMVNSLGGKEGLFRFGGEEFVIVVKEETDAAARETFDSIRAAIGAYAFPQVGHVTVSLGYTEVLAQDVPTTCMERADAALYYAKRNGRNNTREYEALIASGELVDKRNDNDAEFF